MIMLHCAAASCTATVKRGKFNKIRAGERGWFFQVDGTAWCPDHVPEWVPAWRERRWQRQQPPHTS